MNEQSFIDICNLNTYSRTRSNFYILEFRPDIGNLEFLKTPLAYSFNLIHVRYDLLACLRDDSIAHAIISELTDLIRPHKNSIVLGHSFSGYVAYQLACILPEISWFVMIDTRNFLEDKKYSLQHVVISLVKNMYKQVVTNKDYSYPIHLIRGFARRTYSKNEGFDHDFVKAIESVIRNFNQRQSIKNGIFFKASRSAFRNQDFGYEWEPYVSGRFYLRHIISGHNHMLSEHAIEIANQVKLIIDDEGDRSLRVVAET